MEVRNTIPLWFAVGITVVIGLPFGLWLGAWNLPVWAAFLVWAQYFALGAKPEMLKVMAPALILGIAGATVAVIFTLLVSKVVTVSLVTPSDVAWAIGLFLAFCVIIWAMRFMPVTDGPGGLPFFQGIAIGFGMFFTGLYVNYGALSMPAQVDFLLPLITSIPAILASLLGCFLGWFNVTIMFPRPTGTAQQAPQRSAV